MAGQSEYIITSVDIERYIIVGFTKQELPRLENEAGYLPRPLPPAAPSPDFQPTSNIWCSFSTSGLFSDLSQILNNRFYIGELKRNGKVYPGRYRLLIDRRTFERCQELLHGKNRRTGSPGHTLAGGLLRCEFCGQGIS